MTKERISEYWIWYERKKRYDEEMKRKMDEEFARLVEEERRKFGHWVENEFGIECP